MVHRILNGTERFQTKNRQVKEWKLKYNISIQVRSKPADIYRRLTCIQVIVRIYSDRERLHIWKSFECTFTNKWYTEELKDSQFQEQLIFNEKYNCYSPYQKHKYGLFFRIPRRHPSVLLRKKTTVLNHIHGIFIGSRRRNFLSSRICRTVKYLRQILTKDIWL